MNHTLLRLFTSGLWLCCAVCALRAADDTRIYELRTYTATPGKIADVVARFQDNTTRIFQKHGMVNIAYFLPMDPADGAGEKIVYFLGHASREAANASWSAFNADPEWQAVNKASAVNGKIVAKVDRVFLKAADFCPAIVSKAVTPNRVFELRTNTTPEGKINPFDEGFREHTLKLFAKHGIVPLAFWHPTDAQKGAARILIYLLAFPSREEATARWTAFRTDPVWVATKAASEAAAGASFTTEVTSMFLTPIDFSPLK